jgi:hypothetical protein
MNAGGHRVTPDTTGTLGEAYQRLHQTGPEFDGWLSNHGPMAAEAMVRHGHAGNVGAWLDRYSRRLEELPRGRDPIGPDWPEALGDPRRIGDWTGFFGREAAEEPWRQVLGRWWPRLLPGVAASATHGIIRVGHAIRALLADGEDAAHVTELAHGLAYWAARWQPIPGVRTPARVPPTGGAGWHPAGLAPDAGLTPAAGLSPDAGLTPAAALAAVPRIAHQSGGFRERLARLAGLEGWPAALGAPVIADPEQARTWLAGLADAAVTRYLHYAHGSPVMLVHSATAPTAIFRTLPALSRDLWAPSAAAGWEAAAALTAIYAPPEPAPPGTRPAAPSGPGASDEAFARAVAHGDEHVIKFADTAAEVHARTGDPAALAAAVHAAGLVPRPY